MSVPSLPQNPDPVLNVPITPKLVEEHDIRPEEYERILEILGREPSLTELGIFSVMWSEHCSYKNSRKLLRQFPTTKAARGGVGQVLVKAGEENAGVIDIGDGWAVCFKIESHNHPTAIEPFEGAATGVGGIIRDIFTMGARPVLLTNSLRFGELDSADSRRLFRGAVHGIAHYGNCMGIPNAGGDVYFDECYEGNPLVNALCLGVLRHDQIKKGAATGVGNPVYYVGAATGRDGLGGASFASRELTEENAEDRPAVQKGDPFMEKLLLEACLEMMAIEGLVVGIQDMGAAGLTCSTCETAARGDTGVEIELDAVPQREKGMNSYEILLSESQERMLVIIEKGREAELEAVFAKWDLHAEQIGSVTEGNLMQVRQHGELVAAIPAKALADDGPLYDRESKRPLYLFQTESWDADTLEDADRDELYAALPELLDHPTIAQKRWIWRQYDHMVMGNTVVEPGSDAGVIRLRLDDGKEKFIAITNDCNNRYCYLDPYNGSAGAIAEALRNLACSGARPLGMTNNLNFGNPYKPDSFYHLEQGVKGLADACRYFDLPVVGGNVSLYNESAKSGIDPTPVVSVVGLIEKAEHVTRQWIPHGQHTLLLLGGLSEELGGSYFLKVVHDLKTGKAPAVDLEAEKKLHELLLSRIEAGEVAAAHDCSEGGLMVALAEMVFHPEGARGLHLQFEVADNKRLDAALYGESHGRVIVAVKPEAVQSVTAAARAAGVPLVKLGETTETARVQLNIPGRVSLSWDTHELQRAWESAIPRRMQSIAESASAS